MCGQNTGGSGNGVTHKRLFYKRVHSFNANYFVLLRSYRCTRVQCPGVAASKAKWAQKQKTRTDRGMRAKPEPDHHQHIFSILQRPSYDLLPEDLQETFPAQVRAGLKQPRILMDKTVVAVGVAAMAESNGLSGSMCAKVIEESHHAKHGSNELSYYSRAAEHAEWLEACSGGGAGKAEASVMPVVAPHGAFHSKLHRGHAPSKKTMWSSIMAELEHRKEWSQQRLSMMSNWDGTLKGDATCEELDTCPDRLIFHAPHPMSHVPCPMPHIPCPTSHVPCPHPMSHVPCPMPHAPHPISAPPHFLTVVFACLFVGRVSSLPQSMLRSKSQTAAQASPTKNCTTCRLAMA